MAEKVAKLRTMLGSLPEQGIPEFKLLTEDDWYAAVDGPLESTEDYRLAMFEPDPGTPFWKARWRVITRSIQIPMVESVSSNSRA